MSLSALRVLYIYYNSESNLDQSHFSDKQIGAQRSEVDYATKKCQPPGFSSGSL